MRQPAEPPARPATHPVARTVRGPAIVVRLLLAAAFALLALVGGAGAASAHAQLLSSSPAHGDVLETAPEEITLEFNERVEVRGRETRLFTGDGTEIPVTATAGDRTVIVTPDAPLPQGTIVLSWAVTSSDGHPVSGSVTFAVGEPTPGSGANDAFAAPVTTGLAATARAVVGLALLAALALVVLTVLPGVVLSRAVPSGARPRLVQSAWLVGLTATVLAVTLTVIDGNGVGWAGLRDWEQWAQGWISWRGLVLLVAVLAAAYVVHALMNARRVPALVAVAVLALAAPAALAVPGSPLQPVEGVPGGAPVAEAEVAGHTVRVEFAAMVVGTTKATVRVLDEAGDPVEPYAAPRLRLYNDEVDLGDTTLAEVEGEPGAYAGEVTVPQPGDWTATVSIRLDEFTNPVVELPFRFGSRATPVPTGGH